MRRVTTEGPLVMGGQLTGVRDGPLRVGSAAWQTWLATPGGETRAFTFPAVSAGEWHRAIREWRPSGAGRADERPYWYVKCRVGRAIRRFYLGAPADVDGARLKAVAAAIAAARGNGDADADLYTGITGERSSDHEANG
jgi:hypothetical protein